MTDFKIILFLCNWGPHPAYQELQDSKADIPPEIKMVRIPCTGRITKALLFKPFELGADGVLLVGCETGSCRYGKGSLASMNNIEDTRGILELLGLGEDRLRLVTFLPDQSDSLLQFLNEFCNHIKRIGKSPVEPPLKEPPLPDRAALVAETVAAHDVYACQDCGKCTSACPLALAGKPFSPRAIANSIITGRLDDPSVQNDIWSCLTCGVCYERCPSAVNFHEFIRDIRCILRRGGSRGHKAHGGFFQSLMRTMTSPKLKIKHWDWLPDEISTDNKSDMLFFGGCAPYFDIFFRNHLGVKTSDILVDSLRLLNFFDISPALLNEERCCGHDLLWSGDRENFLRLARLNVDAIERMGIREVVFSCPEGYRTFLRDYPENGIETNFKVTHIYELLEKEIDKGAVGFKKLNRMVTFQDPCRLSRLVNSPDLPRKLINRMNFKGFKEMQNREAGAVCCGNSAWIGCDSYSKALQVKRIEQARETESELLITACPKCQIHLRCAMEDPFRDDTLNTMMLDLTGVLARTIQWE